MFLLDDEGVYYWHKRTGTVTRERPELIIDSPSSTLSTSSSLNDACFESNSLLYKSESNSSIKVNTNLNYSIPLSLNTTKLSNTRIFLQLYKRYYESD